MRDTNIFIVTREQWNCCTISEDWVENDERIFKKVRCDFKKSRKKAVDECWQLALRDKRGR